MTRINDNGIDRDMTETELATYNEAKKQMVADMKAQVAAIESVAAAKASARAKLKALGLTDDEIAALVG
jgi:5-bromo-4-chloroindolyl phosphate hydrolysis protein